MRISSAIGTVCLWQISVASSATCSTIKWIVTHSLVACAQVHKVLFSRWMLCILGESRDAWCIISTLPISLVRSVAYFTLFYPRVSPSWRIVLQATVECVRSLNIRLLRTTYHWIVIFLHLRSQSISLTASWDRLSVFIVVVVQIWVMFRVASGEWKFFFILLRLHMNGPAFKHWNTSWQTFSFLDNIFRVQVLHLVVILMSLIWQVLHVRLQLLQ